MSMTYTVQNLSSETAESVDIQPFPRTAWVLTDSDVNKSSIASRKLEQAGDDPRFPLVQIRDVRKTTITHPSRAETYKGLRHSVQGFTNVHGEDTTLGITEDKPLKGELVIAHADGVILEPADVLQFALSLVAELWDSVSTGTPETTVMGKVAIGSVDF